MLPVDRPCSAQHLVLRNPHSAISNNSQIWQGDLKEYKNYLPKIISRKSHILEVIVAVDDECVVLNEWLSADDSQVREDPRKTSQPSGKQWNCEGMNNYAFENDYWTKLNGIEPWMNKISAFNWPNYFFRFWFSLLLYFLLLWTRNYDIACPKNIQTFSLNSVFMHSFQFILLSSQYFCSFVIFHGSKLVKWSYSAWKIRTDPVISLRCSNRGKSDWTLFSVDSRVMKKEPSITVQFNTLQIIYLIIFPQILIALLNFILIKCIAK